MLRYTKSINLSGTFFSLFCLSNYLFGFLATYLSINPFICLSFYLSSSLDIYLSIIWGYQIIFVTFLLLFSCRYLSRLGRSFKISIKAESEAVLCQGFIKIIRIYLLYNLLWSYICEGGELVWSANFSKYILLKLKLKEAP